MWKTHEKTCFLIHKWRVCHIYVRCTLGCLFLEPEPSATRISLILSGYGSNYGFQTHKNLAGRGWHRVIQQLRFCEMLVSIHSTPQRSPYRPYINLLVIVFPCCRGFLGHPQQNRNRNTCLSDFGGFYSVTPYLPNLCATSSGIQSRSLEL